MKLNLKNIVIVPITTTKNENPTPSRAKVPKVDYELPIPETARQLATSRTQIETTYTFASHSTNIRAIEYIIHSTELLRGLFFPVNKGSYNSIQILPNSIVIEFTNIRIRVEFLPKNKRTILFFIKENNVWSCIHKSNPI